MSFEAMTWAVKQDIPAMQKLVLLLMANRHNNDTGLCMPSHDKLAKDCGMSKSAVKAAIKALEEKGLLSVNRRSEAGVSLSNLYRLNTEFNYQSNEEEVGRQKTHPVAKTPTRSPENIGRQKTEGGSPENRGWGAKKPGVGRQKATETGNEPVIETGSETDKARVTHTKQKKSSSVKLTAADLIAEGVAEQTAADFIEVRNAKNAPLTLTALNGIKTEAAKAGYSLENAIRECVMRGWQGFKAAWVANDTKASAMNAKPSLDSSAERNYGRSGKL